MSGTPSQFDLSAWKPLNLQTTSLHTPSNTKDVPNAGDGGRGGGGGGGRRRGGRNFGGPSRHRQQRYQNDQSNSTPTPVSFSACTVHLYFTAVFTFCQTKKRREYHGKAWRTSKYRCHWCNR